MSFSRYYFVNRNFRNAAKQWALPGRGGWKYISTSVDCEFLIIEYRNNITTVPPPYRPLFTASPPIPPPNFKSQIWFFLVIYLRFPNTTAFTSVPRSVVLGGTTVLPQVHTAKYAVVQYLPRSAQIQSCQVWSRPRNCLLVWHPLYLVQDRLSLPLAHTWRMLDVRFFFLIWYQQIQF